MWRWMELKRLRKRHKPPRKLRMGAPSQKQRRTSHFLINHRLLLSSRRAQRRKATVLDFLSKDSPSLCIHPIHPFSFVTRFAPRESPHCSFTHPSMSPFKLTSFSYLTSPIVKIAVGKGDEETVLTAHQKLLVESPFLAETVARFDESGPVSLSPVF